MTNNTGDVIIQNSADDKDIIFKSDDGSGGTETYFYLDGNAGGANPTTVFPDDSRLAIGSSQDLKIYHSPSISYIEAANGELRVRQTTDDGDITFQCDDGSGGLATYLTLDGSTVDTIVHTPLTITAQSSDPVAAIEGQAKIWMSDGTGSGDDGDIMVTITTAAGTVSTTLIDFSSLAE
jgi:hypothetical protein